MISSSKESVNSISDDPVNIASSLARLPLGEVNEEKILPVVLKAEIANYIQARRPTEKRSRYSPATTSTFSITYNGIVF